MSYPLEVKEQAYSLFVESARTAEQVAEQLGITLTTVKSWAETGQWRADREEHLREYLPLIRKAKMRFAKEMANGNTQAAYAHESLLRSRQVRVSDLPLLRAILDFSERKFALVSATLGQVILGFTETKPDLLQLSSAEKRELLTRVQALPEPADAQGNRKGIDPETLRKIREEVYGIVDTSA